jgi:putative heme-binding domain-containing protein
MGQMRLRLLLLSLSLFLLAASPLPSAEWTAIAIPPAAPITDAASVRWYRCYLQVGKNLVDPMADAKDLWRESMTLALQDLPGKVQVSLNGKIIIQTQDVPADAPVRFKVPKNILQNEVYNVLTLRVEGETARRGLTHAPVFGGYLDEVVLHRDWQTHTHDPQPEETFVPLKDAPAIAAYTPKDWRKAATVLQAPDEPVRGRQVSPQDALRHLSTNDALQVESLLHEPAVAQPTHISYDERGRMWIAQYRQYPYPAGLKMISRDSYYRGKYDRVPPAPPYHDQGADIISVHEDRDGDGKYEHSTNVLTGLNMANAAIRGYGGIWVMHTPYLLFYPDADRDDIPDGDPQVRLAGFGLEDTHSTANGLIWGPDGWLYGAQGSTVISHVTRPDADHPGTTPLYLEGCAVWRYHPTTKAFEIFADGSGNTFGVHFDAEGRIFTGHNGGDTRGWHHLQEGIYLKQGTSPDKFGPPTNPFAFGEMPCMQSTHPVPRFSHNIITIAGTAMPSTMRGQLLGADPLHQNLVAAQLIRQSSTFKTTDLGFPLKAVEDMTFRPVYLINAPDGSVTIADFREEYIAHGQNYQGQIDPSSGRIYRLRGKAEKLETDVNLAAKSDTQLVELLSHANLWHRHTAVRLLAERQSKIDQPVERLFAPAADPNHPALEILWVLHQTNSLDEALALKLLDHPGPMVRAWTIRLLGDQKQLSPAFLQAVLKLADTEADAEVRSQILSTARRLPADQALPLVHAILRRDADVDDPFIPLLAWFTIESHCKTSAKQVLTHIAPAKEPAFWEKSTVRQHIIPRLMRRFAAAGTRENLITCAQLLKLAPTDADRTALMLGFEQAFAGRAMPPLPDELVNALAGLGNGSLLLRLRQGEDSAVTEALSLLADPNAKAADRLQYARAFGELHHPQSVPTLLNLAKSDPSVELRKLAISSLMRYDDPTIGSSITGLYPQLPPQVRDSALNLLASRPAWTNALLEAISSDKIPTGHVSHDLLTRLRRIENQDISAKLARLFPAVDKPAANKDLLPRIQEVRAILQKQPGDPYQGEPIYMERCAACHALFHKGGNIGPNLTAYQRDDLGTMLVSIIDPNAEIREGYANHILTTKDGRTLGGFLADQDSNVVVLRGFDGNDITIPRSEIATMQGAGTSLMPAGLLEGLSDQQLRDLFAYLRISQPITK